MYEKCIYPYRILFYTQGAINRQGKNSNIYVIQLKIIHVHALECFLTSFSRLGD